MLEVHIPKNLLVTGGCGFIGSNFVNYIFQVWPLEKLVNVDKLTLNADADYVRHEVTTSERYKLVTADIRNSTVTRRVLIDNKVCFDREKVVYGLKIAILTCSKKKHE